MNILFVCLGNICRSPMAEFIAKNIIKKNNLKNINIKSAGLSNYHYQEDMHKQTKKVLNEKQISVDEFYSKPINQELFNWSDYVLVMDDSNLHKINQLFPNHNQKNNKIYKVTDYSTLDYQNVPDPWYTNNFELVYLILEDSIINFLKQKGFHISYE